MLPRLNENGYLPEGVWDCSLEELRAAFGVFRRSDQRSKLFDKLEKFLSEVNKTKWIEEIIIDGSFVTTRMSRTILILFWLSKPKLKI